MICYVCQVRVHRPRNQARQPSNPFSCAAPSYVPPSRFPCMGLFLSRSSPERQIFCPSSVSLFDLKARFFVPTRGPLTSSRAGAVKVGRRAKLAACSELTRPYLDSFEHDGTLGAIGMTSQRGARFRARISRATTLYSVGPRTRTMMQSYASAAKLRSGGPILPFGIESQGNTSGPRHLEPSSATPSQADRQGRNCWVSFSDLR
jgi:hypothetical protein